MTEADLINAVGLLFLDAMIVKCEPSSYAKSAIALVREEKMQKSIRNTCEVCDENDLSKCRSCTLSGDPNPEAFSREELLRALILEVRIKDAMNEAASRK